MAEWRVPTKLRSCLASTSAYNTLSANRLPEARMNLALARVFTAVLLLCVLKNTTARFYGPLDGHFPAPPAFCLHVVQQYYCTTVFLFSQFFVLSHGGKVLLKWHSQSNRDQHTCCHPPSLNRGKFDLHTFVCTSNSERWVARESCKGIGTFPSPVFRSKLF